VEKSLYSCNSITIQFTITKQLKDLTHMLCFWSLGYKLYKEGFFSYVLGWAQKCWTLKVKSQIKKNFMTIY
jgi:hypothetical protein